MSQSPSLTLGIQAELTLNGRPTSILLVVETDPGSQQQKIYLILQQRRFEFATLSTPTDSFAGFTAAYCNETGDSINISELISDLIPSIADQLPTGLAFSLQQVFVAYQKAPNSDQNPTQASSTFLVGATLGLDINLADLPLIGDKLPADFIPRINGVQILYAYQDISAELINSLKLPEGLSLPSVSASEQDKTETPPAMRSGLYLSACLTLENNPQWVTLPLSRSKKNKSNAASSQDGDTSKESETSSQTKQNPKNEEFNALAQAPANVDDTITWMDVNKKLGPLTLQQVGMQFQNSELWFFLNASLSFGGITLSCNGLGVGSSLTEFKPKFRLNGLGIHYSGGGCLEIGGALLRTTQTLKDEQGAIKLDDNGNRITYEEYSGAVIIGTSIKGKKITLSAIGSYAEVNGEASLFVFALLDYPLGGPPAFFVTGLAAGFGYNRRLNPPETVEAVEDFPFVKLAMGGEDQGKDLLKILGSLGPYIQPASGEMFFAIGIKFTSFKIVDAFILLIVKLGKRTEFHILGLASLVAPPGAEELGIGEPIAEAKLALKAVYIPDEGVLRVEANLQKGSYIFSKKCYLSGGFAFYSWFSGEHEGDFVLTLGGYHPKFKVPSHYPDVPRLKLEWQLNNDISIKGEGYFALTASTLMAGVSLEANFEKGGVKATFKIEAHFLIAWKPFYYEATVALEIRASVKILWKTVSLDIRASLQIWGPPFSGRAFLEVGPISVEMSFGSSLPPMPKALTWQEFKASLLPADTAICNITVSDGLIRKLERNKVEEWIINPKEFAISTDSAIPSTTTNITELNRSLSCQNKISIRPMNLQSSLSSTHEIEIKRSNDERDLVNPDFSYQPIFKKVPTALWGEGFIPRDPNAPQFVENVLCGFHITPKPSETVQKSLEIAYDKLLLGNLSPGKPWQWEVVNLSSFIVGSKSETKNIKQEINNKTIRIKRSNFLKTLGFSPDQDVTINDSFIEDLLGEPHLINSSNKL
jgi:hypothetical protein